MAKSTTEKEMEKLEKQFDKFDKDVKDLTLDRMNMAPKEDSEQQTKMSQKDLNRANEIYLKPKKTISCQDKFNEDFRKMWEHDKEYVQFIAENKEIIGETIDLWTKPYAGIPAMEWEVPVNKPVWGPRYLANQLKNCTYHRLVMQENRTIATDGLGSYYGSMVADSVINRLDAHPVSQKRSVFMGASNF